MNFLVMQCCLLVMTTSSVSGISFWDSVPAVAQGKVAFLYIIGEDEAAKQTDENFRNITYLWENIKGLQDSIPGYGHVRGLIVYLEGDKERGAEIIAAAQKSTCIIGGFMLGGPVGAVGGSLFADTTSSLVMNKPQGIIDHMVNFENKTMDEHFDAVLDLTMVAVGSKVPKSPKLYSKIRMTMKKVERNTKGTKTVTFNDAANQVVIISPNRSPLPSVSGNKNPIPSAKLPELPQSVNPVKQAQLMKPKTPVNLSPKKPLPSEISNAESSQ